MDRLPPMVCFMDWDNTGELLERIARTVNIAYS